MFATNSTMLGEYMSKYVPQKLDVIELHDVSFDVAAEVRRCRLSLRVVFLLSRIVVAVQYVQSRISDNGAPLSAEALAAIMVKHQLRLVCCVLYQVMSVGTCVYGL
ncbi:MAG: hypothetical protein P4L40_13775 [Terracidiphilus sp.]|nr:hypothetical protein [Terracidiphilus sp.]